MKRRAMLKFVAAAPAVAAVSMIPEAVAKPKSKPEVPQVHVHTIECGRHDLRDADPDRLMAVFMRELDSRACETPS